ncbi:MAG: flagellar biosynthesis regulator FlaF [Pseudomonadota bacterium]
MQALALKAYGEVQKRTADPRSIEAALFRQITDRLIAAQDLRETDPSGWAEAINKNLELWNVLASDLLHPENQLNESIRKPLIELSIFVRRATTKILSGSDGMDDLIAINESIALGLQPSG